MLNKEELLALNNKTRELVDEINRQTDEVAKERKSNFEKAKKQIEKDIAEIVDFVEQIGLEQFVLTLVPGTSEYSTDTIVFAYNNRDKRDDDKMCYGTFYRGCGFDFKTRTGLRLKNGKLDWIGMDLFKECDRLVSNWKEYKVQIETLLDEKIRQVQTDKLKSAVENLNRETALNAKAEAVIEKEEV